MTVSTALDEQQQAILELIAQLRARPRRRHATMPELVEAVLLTLAIEELVLDEPDSGLRRDAGWHRAAHTRARLALFRAVTSATDSEVFDRSLADLRDVFGSRLRELAAGASGDDRPDLVRRIDEHISSVRGAAGSRASADFGGAQGAHGARRSSAARLA